MNFAYPAALLPAYIVNIVILIPVVTGLYFRSGTATVFGGKVAPSDGLRWMVASLYTGILAGSVVGVIWPEEMAPILGLQVVYKAMWLIAYVWPSVRARQPVPIGLSLAFAAIVTAYPALIICATIAPA
ncbi:hypothetical protein [Maricaulis sp.]|uniref:hypothetical protein n=1 Tax=Maricaulis sp. TaxID=1486257 RepID=UPI00261F1C98|nr:hypothetical protein [Maricaulis sp.]